ncbi:glycosyl hydrolase family 18 protein [Microbacterium gubbeenense]|uniref:glycosyl hydrolase family 18 protein n=1 Tax=Microbacterium gubbeenense TaxID=159896 RepID=UPI003F97087D
MANEDVWCWVGHLGISDRIDMVLTHYGDRLTDVSIFGWYVSTDGSLTETLDPAVMDGYRERWPHIRWWAAFRNMDNPDEAPRAIFDALRGSAAARAALADAVEDVFTAYPWLHGVDIDLEQGGDGAPAQSEAIYLAVADRAHLLGRKAACALPPLTASGSVGGEDWVRYAELGAIVDHVEIMTYDFAWMGSAPGPIAPGFWVRDVADWVASQIDPAKVSLGVPLYAYFWTIHAYPDNDSGWRGDSGTYYAAWQHFTGFRTGDGTQGAPQGDGSHERIGWVVYRDEDSQSLWGYTDVYDWLEPSLFDSSVGVVSATFDGRHYTTRYGQPVAEPLWGVVDNRTTDEHAAYTIEPRRVVSERGNLVEPSTGFGFTLDLLQREPVAATILDDYITSETAYVREGDWDVVDALESYRQWRGSGVLTYDNDFGEQPLYVQARGKFASDGRFSIYSQGWAVRYSNATGLLELVRSGTVEASAYVTPRESGAAPQEQRFVLGLRVRENSARAYFGLTEEGRIPTMLSAAGQAAPGEATSFRTGLGAEVWLDHLYLGDGWWYMPRERVVVQIDAPGVSEEMELGGIARSGVTWRDGNSQFRPDEDVDEHETREASISRDWAFHHWNPSPLVSDVAHEVTIVPRDHDVWVGRLVACDADYARIIYVHDPQGVLHWRAVAAFDYGFAGVAMWSLGQEDVRLWDLMQGGFLPPETKRLNA